MYYFLKMVTEKSPVKWSYPLFSESAKLEFHCTWMSFIGNTHAAPSEFSVVLRGVFDEEEMRYVHPKKMKPADIGNGDDTNVGCPEKLCRDKKSDAHFL